MLDAVTRVLPRLADRFPTHQAWAEATMDTVLGEWRTSAQQVEAAWLESTLFLNRGSCFEVRWPGGRMTSTPLPPGVGEIKVHADGESEVLKR